jgi:mRNA interferase RelE/StbE
VSGTDPAAGQPYAVLLSGQARRNIRENLPLEVALAAMETIDGSIAATPNGPNRRYRVADTKLVTLAGCCP